MNKSFPDEDCVWLHHAGQSLALAPAQGGGVAAWRTRGADGHSVDLWRPWDGSADRYALASFAMVPWSNRISAHGFEHGGRFHPVAPNRAGELYPIHGDGWLHPWNCTRPAADTLVMHLPCQPSSHHPYLYEATQRFELSEGRLRQSVQVRHCGADPLPYGLGLHPWFDKTPQARVRASVSGAWLSGQDPIPTGYTPELPADWNLRHGIGAHGSFIDNAFSGWDGQALIEWPEWGVRLALRAMGGVDEAREPVEHCLVYRPLEGAAFCFEPITHPIDAFHLDGRPGLQVLSKGQALSLEVEWRVEFLRPDSYDS